jgi:hypothetical protein
VDFNAQVTGRQRRRQLAAITKEADIQGKRNRLNHGKMLAQPSASNHVLMPGKKRTFRQTAKPVVSSPFATRPVDEARKRQREAVRPTSTLQQLDASQASSRAAAAGNAEEHERRAAMRALAQPTSTLQQIGFAPQPPTNASSFDGISVRGSSERVLSVYQAQQSRAQRGSNRGYWRGNGRGDT